MAALEELERQARDLRTVVLAHTEDLRRCAAFLMLELPAFDATARELLKAAAELEAALAAHGCQCLN